MAAFGVINHFPTPGFNHSAQNAWELCTSYPFPGKYFGIMATHMFNTL